MVKWQKEQEQGNCKILVPYPYKPWNRVAEATPERPTGFDEGIFGDVTGGQVCSRGWSVGGEDEGGRFLVLVVI